MATKKVKKFVIDRAKWGTGKLLHGPDNGFCQLGKEAGKMCCLGFYLKALGKKDKTIRYWGMPADLEDRLIPDEAKWLIDRTKDQGNSAIANELAAINDEDPPGKRKERKIANRFAKHGIKVEFV